MKLAKKSISLLLSIILIISAFAIVPMAASAGVNTIGVFFTDSESWDGSGVINVYAWDDDGELTGTWPGAPMTYLYDNGMRQSVYGAKIPADATGVVFNCGGNQTGDIESGIVDGAWWYSDNNTAVALNNTYVAAQAATCTEAGVVAHYDLDDNVYDVNLTATTEEAVVIPAGHNLSHVDAVDATPTTDGNVEYWHCTVCEKNFSDAEGTTEIDDVVVPATGVATINGTPYTSLAAAVAAAEDGDTIKVIADCDAAYISVKGKAITINVASKATITGVQYAGMDVPMFKVASTGSLTFTGSGTVINENDVVVNNSGYVKNSGTTLNGNLCAIYNGGTAEVTSGKVIGVQASIINAKDTATTTISNGTFTGKLENADPDATFVVSGGNFDAPVDLDFVTAVFEVTRPNGIINYNSSPNAFLLQANGSTIKMLKDFTTTSCPNAGSSMYKNNTVTLDLNGYTLNVDTTTNRDYCIIVTEKNNLTVKNGTIIMAPTAEKRSNGFAVQSGSSLTIEDDVDIIATNGVSAVSVFGAATLTTEGTLTAEDSFTIAGNGSSGNGGYTININGGYVGSNVSAIYHCNSGTLNVTDGTIVGATALYVKSGTTNISGGGFYGIGEAKDYEYYGNGAYATGDALVVDNCGYPGGTPVLNITGGTFDSENAAPVASYQYGNNAAVKFFLTGGQYSEIVPEELIANGYFCKAIKNVDGYYDVVADTCAAHNFVYFADDEAVACTICGKGYTGLFDVDGTTYYFENGKVCGGKGLIMFEGDIYFVVYSGKIAKNSERAVQPSQTNGLMPSGTYYFDEDGKMVMNNGIVDGYYYENGVVVGAKGLVLFEGDYYYVLYSGKIAKSQTRTITGTYTNGLMPDGTYDFDEEGKMIIKEGIVDGYYYENGVVVTGGKGLIEVDGDYYYVLYSGKIAKSQTRTITGTYTNDLMPDGTYEFDADGKMIIKNGVIGDYYYENGVVVGQKWLIKQGNDYYYVLYSGKIAKSQTRTITGEYTNGLVPNGTYTFGADGKMIDPPAAD